MGLTHFSKAAPQTRFSHRLRLIRLSPGHRIQQRHDVDMPRQSSDCRGILSGRRFSAAIVLGSRLRLVMCSVFTHGSSVLGFASVNPAVDESDKHIFRSDPASKRWPSHLRKTLYQIICSYLLCAKRLSMPVVSVPG